jgi:hypothetical protein
MRHDPVMTTEAQRAEFERDARSLEGLRIDRVDYWDIHYPASEPASWDHGDWHHAVMGVELTTDAGPWTLIWTDRFFPYGVEVFPDPISQHLVLGETGPQRIGPDGPTPWQCYLGKTIERVAVDWDRLEVGPGHVVDGPSTVDVPSVVRLDFDAGSVWFIAAMPNFVNPLRFESLGDEIVIAFTEHRFRSVRSGIAEPD